MKKSTNQRNALTRRAFLAAAGAAASLPAILPSRVLAAEGKPGANDRLTIAHIGVGGMGGYHLNDIKRFVESGDVSIAAVCDATKTVWPLPSRRPGPVS